MLTRLEAISTIDFSSRRIIPDRLTRLAHAQYALLARKMLATYQYGSGRTRRELHQSIAQLFVDEDDCPTRRIAAFCKLLDDYSEYERDAKGEAARLRGTVFKMAAQHHPLVQQPHHLFESDEATTKQFIAGQLETDWDSIEQKLYSDIIDFHRLQSFQGPTEPTDLLARYNVAQVQAALYQAVSITVRATADFKTILRYAKLARLLHVITRVDADTYLFQFDGPASILKETRRYGVRFAKFLPALIACRGWQMRAIVVAGTRDLRLRLDLSDQDGLHSHLPPPDEFDSDLEERFALEWGDDPRDGWSLRREASVLTEGQKTFVPDFEFRHTDGRRVLMEVIGFWTPEYLQAKASTLQQFADHHILLAINKNVTGKIPQLVNHAIIFGSRLHVKDVVERLAKVARTGS